MGNHRFHAFAFYALFFLVVPVVGWAQVGSQAFTLEQVLSSPFPTNLVAADHFPRIAWIFSSKGEHNVWVADAPNFEARQVTHYTGDDGQPLAN